MGGWYSRLCWQGLLERMGLNLGPANSLLGPQVSAYNCIWMTSPSEWYSKSHHLSDG